MAPSSKSLKSLKFDLYSVIGDTDPLCGISSELEKFRGGNVLETIAISLYLGLDMECRIEEWGDLDQVLTQPGWPELKTVYVQIRRSKSDMQEREFHLILRNLTVTHFSRLTSSSTIQFDFECVV